MSDPIVHEKWHKPIKTHTESCDVSGPDAFIEVRRIGGDRLHTYYVECVTVVTAWESGKEDEAESLTHLDVHYKLIKHTESIRTRILTKQLLDDPTVEFEVPKWIEAIELRAFPRL